MHRESYFYTQQIALIMIVVFSIGVELQRVIITDEYEQYNKPVYFCFPHPKG